MPFFGGQGDYFIVGTNVKGGTDAAPAVIGDNNMALGNGALQALINGDQNIAIGTDAGTLLTNVSGNIVIGYGAQNADDGVSYSTIIGWGAQAAAGVSENVILGNGSNGLGDGAIAIGASASADSESVAIGWETIAGLNSIAIGRNLLVADNAIVIGDASAASIEIGGVDFSGGPGFSLPYSGDAGTLVADTKTFANSVTWNNAGITFTGWQLNVTDTASNAASLLMDLRVGGSTKLKVGKNAQLQLANLTGKNWAEIATGGIGGAIRFNTQDIADRGSHYFDYAGIINVVSTESAFIGFSSSITDATNSNSDTKLCRDAAGIFAQRNDTNAQTFRLYNTYADASNYERASFTWSGNICYLKPEAAGTGVSRPLITVHGSTTVAGLPAASAALTGARTFVTDSNASYSAGNIGNIVAAGGGQFVPVYCDGTNWRIG